MPLNSPNDRRFPRLISDWKWMKAIEWEGERKREIGYGERTGFTRTLYIFVKKNNSFKNNCPIVLHPCFLKDEETRSWSDKMSRVSFRYLRTDTTYVEKSFLYFQGSLVTRRMRNIPLLSRGDIGGYWKVMMPVRV